MPIAVKRIYQAPAPEDGYRVLVDRLWPRGFTKEKAKLDEWIKDIAPSDALRQWIHNDPSQWEEFRARYFAELEGHRDKLLALARRAAVGPVSLIYSAKNTERNNATVLQEYLEKLAADLN